MAFKIPQQKKSYSLDSPEAMLHDIRSKRIEGPLATQADIWRDYQQSFYNHGDVAINLPTGAGKTLVGLAIGEWRRRKNGERVVFLCPTNQLVNQVVSQSSEQYGIDCIAFTGKKRDYSNDNKARYRRNDAIAVTTYSALFNNNSYFSDADILILDDAHASENYIASMWSFDVSKANNEILYDRLINLFDSSFERIDFTKCLSAQEYTSNQYVDMLPLEDFWKISDTIKAILDKENLDESLRYTWQNIRDNLTGCCLYYSHKQILIRPFVPPTYTHTPFNKPKQRIYMSATLGRGGEIERLTGRRNIARLKVSGSDRQGIGRRFFIFPELCESESALGRVLAEVVKQGQRLVALSQSNREVETLRKFYSNNFDNVEFFTAANIEQSKEQFINSAPAVAAVANRYDGMDFPGSECRFLFITGLPTAMNLQEKFLMNRMGCEVAFHDRIQTRIVQAVGRCTRSNNDYAAVIINGSEWLDYLIKSGKSKFLHPELQAEIRFGDTQSSSSIEDIEENIQHFLASDDDWRDAEQVIISDRDSLEMQSVQGESELGSAVKHEIEFSDSLWRGDFVGALGACRGILELLQNGEVLRGYRALWNYFAGSVVKQSERMNYLDSQGGSRDYYQKAASAAKMVPWLITLVRMRGLELGKDSEDLKTYSMIESIESKLLELGVSHDKNFNLHLDEIREKLSHDDAKKFEEGQRMLGDLLGFTCGNIETQGAPDPWWILSEGLCVVFEDYTGAAADSEIPVKKARQVATHENWLRDNVTGIDETTEIIPVIVSSATKLNSAAAVHCNDVFFIETKDFRAWSESVLKAIVQIRTTLIRQSSFVWREESVQTLKSMGIDHEGVVEFFKKRPARDSLIIT